MSAPVPWQEKAAWLVAALALGFAIATSAWAPERVADVGRAGFWFAFGQGLGFTLSRLAHSTASDGRPRR